MTNLSVIILVGKEAIHIQRCMEKLAPLAPRKIFVVESQKGDRTHEIAVETAKSSEFSVQSSETVSGSEFRVERDVENSKLETLNSKLNTLNTRLNLVWHDWPGLQSKQFNWALDNLPLEGEWILRLDADEYLTDESLSWLKENLGSIPSDVNALEFTLERKFCGGEIRHGTNGIKMVRMFRRGHGRYAETAMDERLLVGEFEGFEGFEKSVEWRLVRPGKVQSVPVVFYDDNLNSMDWWREKHRGYAKREAQQAIESMRSGVWVDPRKAKYYKLPPYFRAFAYFCIRYFLKGGILDGYAGWMWNFWQGLWYRLLVDREISHLQELAKKV